MCCLLVIDYFMFVFDLCGSFSAKSVNVAGITIHCSIHFALFVMGIQETARSESIRLGEIR